MNIIKTKSFELAILTRGNENSDKLAILMPGRLDTKDYINFVSHAEYLANKGFFAVAFDPPGTWESPGSINLFTTTNYLKAINELIEYFGNKQTLLIGHSRGATVAMLASMSNQAITGIVLIMANYGMPTTPSKEALQKGFEVSLRDFPPGDSVTSEQKEFKLPLAYWEDAQQYNPMEALKKCTKPKLLIYGTNDEFTSSETEKKLYDDLLEPKMMLEVNSIHDYRRYAKAIEEINIKIGQFLDKFIKLV